MRKLLMLLFAGALSACGDADVSGTTGRPTSDCVNGATDGPCDLGLCADGSRFPALRTCVGGQFYCLPVSPGCGRVMTDAGPVTVDAPSVPDASSEVSALTIEWNGADRGPIWAGRNYVTLDSVFLHANRDVEIRELRFRVVVIDGAGQLSDAMGNTFLWNVRLIDGWTQQQLGGPMEAMPGPNAHEMEFRFTQPFTMLAGRELRIDLKADIPYRLNEAFPGTRFRVVADGGNGHYFPDGSVRMLGGGIVPPDLISGNYVRIGGDLVLRRPTLVANLAIEPGSQTVAKNAMDVLSASINLSAGTDGDVRLNAITVSGVGDTGSGFRRDALSNIVTSCTLRDSGMQLGTPMIPTAMWGRMEFTGLDIFIPRGTTRTLRIHCNTDYMVANERGDRYAVTIASETDLRSSGMGTGDPGFVVMPPLWQQIYDPTVIITVVPNGTVTLSRWTPSSRTHMGGGTALVDRYQISSTIETVAIDRVAIRMTGNTACVSSISVFAGSVTELGRAIFPASTTESVANVTLTTPVRTPSEGSADIAFIATFNPAVDPRVNPAGCHAGDVLTFSLASGITTGEWSAPYAGSYNIHAVGDTSGNVIYTAVVPETGTNEVTIR